MNFVIDGPQRDTTTGGIINRLAYDFRKITYGACEDRGQELGKRIIGPGMVVANIGGCDGQRWDGVQFCDAKHTPDMDFNTKPLPYATATVDVAICERQE